MASGLTKHPIDSATRGEERDSEQNRGGVIRTRSKGHGYQRNQEERHLRGARPRPPGEGAPQSPRGAAIPRLANRIQIKAKTVVKFRVAKAAKDAIAPKK